MRWTLVGLALSVRSAAAYSGGSGGSNGGMSCDAIGVCAGGTCPDGMSGVGPPTRSTVYSIRTKGAAPYVAGGDPTTYTPGESMSIWITVEEIKIQRKELKGQLMCFCPDPKKGQINRPGGDTCGRDYRGLRCDDPHYEDAGYRGLLIYAVNDQEEKVGGWEIPRSLPPIFWLPPDSACKGKSIVHADATIKNYQHEIVFTPPPAGTGSITFRALLKQGKTEMGAFYWPTAPASSDPTAVPVSGSPSGDLTLTESGAQAPAQLWYLATAGDQSCDDVCAATTAPGTSAPMVCDQAALGDKTNAGVKDSPSAVWNAIAKYYTGAKPMLGDCEPFHPSMSATDEKWTFFHRTTNTVANQVCPTPQTPTCSAKPSADAQKSTLNFRRLCPCKANRRRLQGSAANVAEPVANAAEPSRLVQYASALTLSAAVALGRGGGLAASAPLLLLAASQLLPRAEAHNWLWNPKTRFDNLASMTQPCRAKSSKTPAMHLNPLQIFEVEWATGHAGQARRFTIVKAEDEKYLAMLNEGIHQDYLDTAPPKNYLPTGGKWEKRHLSWGMSQDGAMSRNHGPCENSKHVAEGKTLVTNATDPHFITRAQAFKCSWLGRHSSSPDSGDQCYEVGDGGLQQFKYPTSMSGMKRVTEHSSTTYPWIVAAHAFTPAPFAKDYANQADVARFPAPSLPGLYVMHWWWRGLTACVDFAVMPTKANGGTDVPDGGRYQIAGTRPAWERTTHAHLDLKYLSFAWAINQNTLANGQCSDTNSPPKKRLCFVIPPEDGVNALGETAAQALAACQERCAVDFAGAPGTIGCAGVNVIPIDLPAEVRFRDATTAKAGTYDWAGGTKTTDHNIPWGFSNCDRTCVGSEPANSMMCYPQVVHGDNMYLVAEVLVVENDPSNAIWYSSSFKKVKEVDFPGVDTRCEDFEWPVGSGKKMCGDPAPPPRWKFGDRCISCELMDKNANASMVVQRWAVLPVDECKMCSYTAAPMAPAPTPPPTVDPNAYNDGSSWPRNFTAPSNGLFIGWKQGGVDPADANALNALTFLFACPACDANGWVALGINHDAHAATPGKAAMVGTKTIIWEMATDTIREYMITGKDAASITPWAQQPHVTRVATAPATKRATFSLGTGDNPFNHWQIADEHINLIADQEVMWAYGSNHLSYHQERGLAKFDFSGFPKSTTTAPVSAGAHGPTQRPTSAPTTAPTKAPLGKSNPSPAPTLPTTRAIQLAAGVRMGWKRVAAPGTATTERRRLAAAYYEFTLTIDSTFTSGWLAIGVHKDANKMEKTHAVLWDLSDGSLSTLRSLENRAYSPATTPKEPLTETHTLTQSGTVLTFTATQIGDYPIAGSGAQDWAFAFSKTGTFPAQHSDRGSNSILFDFAPLSPPPTTSPSTGGGANSQSSAGGAEDDGAAVAVAVILSLLGAAAALLVVAGVATVVIVLIVTKKQGLKKKSLAPDDSKLDHNGVELSRINSRVTMTNPLSGGGNIDGVMAGAVVGKSADQTDVDSILAVGNPVLVTPTEESKVAAEVASAAASISLAKLDAGEVRTVPLAAAAAVTVVKESTGSAAPGSERAALKESNGNAASGSESAAFKLFRTSMTELDGSDAATAAVLAVQTEKTSTERSEAHRPPAAGGHEESDDFHIDLDASHEEEEHEHSDDFHIDLNASHDEEHDDNPLAADEHEFSESGDFDIDLEASHGEDQDSDFSGDEIQL